MSSFKLKRDMAFAAGVAGVFGALFLWGANASFVRTILFKPQEYSVLTSKEAVVTEAAVSEVSKLAELLPPTHVKTPEPVRAIYMTSWVAGTPSFRKTLVDFMRESEINAVVIDVKDYTGNIAFRTGNPAVEKEGGEENRVADMRAFIDSLHAEDMYVIARISVFQDPHYAARHTNEAVQRKNGALWKDRKGLSWVDPASQSMWRYIVEVARASERVGFDELNFDYIRFPSDGNMEDIVFPIWDGKTSRADVLEQFFKYLDTELADIDVPLSLDLFGMTMTNTDDLNIGQVLEKAAPYADFIAPMVYPSHYPPTWHGFKNPAANPYEVIYYAMSEGARRLEAASSTRAKLRPWIQDFDLGADYTAAMIQKEKQAVYDAGLTSWMAWDPKNIYTKEAYITP